MKTTLSLLLVAAIAAGPAAAAPQEQYVGAAGSLALLPMCPGDALTRDAAALKRDEGFFEVLLTPFLTGLVGGGLKAVGAKLKEAAQEMQVDVLHAGDYFYRPVGVEKADLFDINATNDVDPKSRCLIVASRGTVKTDGELAALVKDYSSADILATGDNALRTITAWHGGSNELANQLESMGFDKEHKPGLLLVADLELATTAGTARLVPRFVVLDHSVREKRVDARARDMTLEIALQAAGTDAAFTKATLKFEGLKLHEARKRLSFTSGAIETTQNASVKPLAQLTVTSPWFALPALDADSKARVAAVEDANKALRSNLDALSLAASEALELAPAGAHDIPIGEGNKPECPSEAEANQGWLVAAQALQRVSVATKKDEAAIIYRTKVVSFYDACRKYNAAAEVKRAKRFKRQKNSTSAETILAFDVDVHIKEFRERPAVQFFGDLLSDDTTRGGLTSAIIGEIDPATRAKNEKTKSDADLKARGDYEAALVAAESAIVAHATAKEEEKAGKFIDMEAKKRAANRLAEALDMPLPYPSSGTWLVLTG